MSAVLLDTSGFRAMQRSHPAVLKALEVADRVVLNAVAIGEILCGYAPGKNAEANKRYLWDFVSLAGVDVVPMDEETGVRFALIYDFLRKKGTSVSPNDMWMAATAMQHGLTVVTLDRDFLKIPQIVVDCFDSGW